MRGRFLLQKSRPTRHQPCDATISELTPTESDVKVPPGIFRRSRKETPLLKAVTLKEIERIFEIIEPLGISREAVVIPLRPGHPGRVRILPNGKLEIIVERDDDLDQWMAGLSDRIAALLKQGG
jgi:hypothetical protein